MSEQASGTSDQMEEALRDQLARKDERIGMLEALLEQTRSLPESGEHRSHSRGEETSETAPRQRSGGAMAFPTPPPKTGGAQAFQSLPPKPAMTINPVERVPIKLPAFTGQGVDAIVGLVMEKASEQNCLSVMSSASSQAASAHKFPLSEAEEEGYEPTARFNAQHPQRQRAERNHRNFLPARVGSMALVSVAVAALGVGVWQHRQSVLLSDAMTDIRPLPPLTPPSPLSQERRLVAATTPRSLPHLPQPGPVRHDTPVVEPRDDKPEPSRPEHQAASGSIASASTAAPLRTAHSHVETSGAAHARPANTHKVEVASTRAYITPRIYATSHRETQVTHDTPSARNAQTHPKDNSTTHPPINRSNDAQAATSEGIEDRLPPYRSDREADANESRSNFPDDRNVDRADEQRVPDEPIRRPRRRRREADEPYRVTEQSNEVSPRRRLQGNVSRAVRTLDNMQDLLDSIERRKQRQAASSSN